MATKVRYALTTKSTVAETGDKSATNSTVADTVDFVASVYGPKRHGRLVDFQQSQPCWIQLCRQCVPGFAVAQKKLEAAHYKFQRRMVDISWKDKVSNKRARTQTQLEKIDRIIKERRLGCLHRKKATYFILFTSTIVYIPFRPI